MKRQLITAAIAALGFFASAHAAEILVNGDFENEPNWGGGVSHDAGYTLLIGNELPGWTITPGHGVTIHGPGLYPHINNYTVNMDGEGYNGTNADFYQDFSSVNGQPYAFSYDHLGWFQTAIGAAIQIVDLTTSTTLYSNVVSWTPNVVHESATFTGTGDTLRLHVFESPFSGYNDNTMQLDNFSVSAVPEPGTLGILAVGSLLAVRRRRVAI